MTRRLQIFFLRIILGTALVFGLAQAANAASMAPLGEIQVDQSSLVVKVHGFHQRCQWGPNRGWWHANRSYRGRPFACARPAPRRRTYNPPQRHRAAPQRRRSHSARRRSHPARRHHRRNCRRDWHCTHTGPFGIFKKCFWRTLCN